MHPDPGAHTKNPWPLKPVLHQANKVLESDFTTATAKAVQSESCVIASSLNKLA